MTEDHHHIPAEVIQQLRSRAKEKGLVTRMADQVIQRVEEVIPRDEMVARLDSSAELIRQITLGICANSPGIEGAIAQARATMAAEGSLDLAELADDLAELMSTYAVEGRREVIREQGPETVIASGRKCLQAQLDVDLTDEKKIPPLRTNLHALLQGPEDMLFHGWGIASQEFTDVRDGMSYREQLKDENRGTPAFIDAQREVQKIYTQSMMRRWIQGSTTPTSHITQKNGMYYESTDSLQRGEMSAEQIRLYAVGLDHVQSTIEAGLPLIPAEWNRLVAETNEKDPIVAQHRDATSWLFDGMHAEAIPINTDITRMLKTTPEQARSYARGAALKVFVDGGRDIQTYISVISAFPDEQQSICNMGLAVWEETKDTDKRKTLAQLLLNIHERILRGDRRSELETAAPDMVEYYAAKQKLEEQIRSGALAGAEKTLVSQDMRDHQQLSTVPADFARVSVEGTTQEADAQTVELARVILYTQLASRVMSADLGVDSAGLSIIEMASRAQKLGSAVEHLHLLEPKTAAIGSPHSIQAETARVGMTNEYTIPQEMRGTVLKINFVRTVLTETNMTNLPDKVRAFFEQAQDFGVTRAELIQLHNQIFLAAQVTNETLARHMGSRFNPNSHAIRLHDVMLRVGPDKTGAFLDHTLTDQAWAEIMKKDGSTVAGAYSLYDSKEDGFTAKEEAGNTAFQTSMKQGIDGELDPVLRESDKLANVSQERKDDQRVVSMFTEGKLYVGGYSRVEWKQQQSVSEPYSPQARDIATTIQNEVFSCVEPIKEESRVSAQLITDIRAFTDSKDWSEKSATAFNGSRGRLNSTKKDLERQIEEYLHVDKTQPRTKVNLIDISQFHLVGYSWQRDQEVNPWITAIKSAKETKIKALADEASQKLEAIRQNIPTARAMVGMVLESVTVPPFSVDKPITGYAEIKLPANFGPAQVIRLADMQKMTYQEQDTMKERLVYLRDRCLSVDAVYGENINPILNGVTRELNGEFYSLSKSLLDKANETRMGDDRVKDVARAFNEIMQEIMVGNKAAKEQRAKETLQSLDLQGMTSSGSVGAAVATGLERHKSRLEQDISRRP